MGRPAAVGWEFYCFGNRDVSGVKFQRRPVSNDFGEAAGQINLHQCFGNGRAPSRCKHAFAGDIQARNVRVGQVERFMSSRARSMRMTRHVPPEL